MKHLQCCLNIIIELIPIIEKIHKKDIEVPEDDINEYCKLINEKNDMKSFDTCSSLLILVKQRLQYTLRLLIKICMSKPPINKNNGKYGDVYKTCYSLTFNLENRDDFYLFVNKLVDVLNRIDDAIMKLDD